jgi:hypothetical protein
VPTCDHGRVAGVLKVTEAAARAQAQIADLAAARQLHGRIRIAVTQITQRLWGDLPAEDLASA